MSFLLWIALGSIVGVATAKFLVRGRAVSVELFLGTLGALTGGYLHQIYLQDGMTDWDPWSLVSAACGAVLSLFAYYGIRKTGWLSR